MLHDLIIWPNAQGFVETILCDLRRSFDVLSDITIHWDDDRWDDNIRVFYSRSWQGLSVPKLRQAVQEKADYCGRGPFSLIVFEDSIPEMTFEQTTEGRSEVNARVFNKKKEYRKLTGGGHLVHSSNNAQETDRDLALLLGVGAEDFLEGLEAKYNELRDVFRNCTGIDGYDSLVSFFYTLNHTIDYCVLRNFECLPDWFFEQGHEDIDLLVENISQMIQLTSARPISGEQGRVDYSIRISGKDVPFDFRHIGDNYYDLAWERSILKNKRQKRGLYVPGDEDLYYSLLYHAYIQKHSVKPDYFSKLEEYGSVIGIHFSPEIHGTIRQLDTFLKGRGYEYIIPEDKTVVYNRKNLEFSAYALRNGACLKHTDEVGCNGYVYTSKVFQGNGTMIKSGTGWLMDNEAAFLERLSNSHFFPKILSQTVLDNGETQLTLSRIDGECFDSFFNNVSHQKACFLRPAVFQLVSILRVFQERGILHRDLQPSNIIVNVEHGKLKMGVIDFGWAIDAGSDNAKKPSMLGGRYSRGNQYSDCFSAGTILMEYWADLPIIRLVASLLFKATGAKTESRLKKAVILARLPLGPYELFRLFLRRHQRVSMIWHSLLRK